MPETLMHTLGGLTLEPNHTRRDKLNTDTLWAQTYADSTFHQRDSQGIWQQPEAREASDDIAYVGFNYQGLPVLLSIAGCDGCNSSNIKQFVGEQIVPLLNRYTLELSQSSKPHQTVCALMRKIYDARELNQGIEFTLSVAICYQNNSRLSVAGFGIGDTGLVYRAPNNGNITQLTHKVLPQGRDKDAFFDDRLLTGEIIDRNCVFNQEIAPGGQLLAYTSLLDNMSVEHCDSQGNRHFFIDETLLVGDDTLIANLSQRLELKKQEQTKAASDEVTQLGDDFTLTWVSIPKEGLQQRLQKRHSARLPSFYQQVIQACDAYLAFSTQQCERHRLFGGRITHWRHGSSGRERVNALKALILSGSMKQAELLEQIKTVYEQSADFEHSFSRYFEKQLNQNCARFSETKDTFWQEVVLPQLNLNPEPRERKYHRNAFN